MAEERITAMVRVEPPDASEKIIAQFSTTFNLIATENETYLSFYQQDLPFLDINTPLEAAPPAKLRCVARIVLTPKGVLALAELLDQQVKRVEQRLKGEEST